MLNDMLLAGVLLFGHVDQIEGTVAIIEYQQNKQLRYREVDIIKTSCIPVEGQAVLFDRQQIVVCLCLVKVNEIR